MLLEKYNTVKTISHSRKGILHPLGSASLIIYNINNIIHMQAISIIKVYFIYFYYSSVIKANISAKDILIPND